MPLYVHCQSGAGVVLAGWLLAPDGSTEQASTRPTFRSSRQRDPRTGDPFNGVVQWFSGPNLPRPGTTPASSAGRSAGRRPASVGAARARRVEQARVPASDIDSSRRVSYFGAVIRRLLNAYNWVSK